MQTAVVHPRVAVADPQWPQAFEAERAALVALLGVVLKTDVEHVGSTSVPGLSAKPIIDMLAGVESLEVAAGAHARLAGYGYAYRPHRPEAHLFIRVDADGVDTHHLHLTVPASDLWVERLAFRDALRGDTALVASYAAWKAQHATGSPDGAYDAVKTAFVGAVLAKRGIRLRPDRQRLGR